uniref:Uncharacterized protein n=1 Tax=Nelumbo nucifera TaxID=4432 RepID=A0A822YDZ2_NELNU|nr:TPA_asm: hypothetical protein HUJ06_030937 [Nelumbo nucifera]
MADPDEGMGRLTASPLEFAGDSTAAPPTSTASSSSASASYSSVGSENIRGVSSYAINQGDQFLKEAVQNPGEHLSIGICSNIKTKSSRTDAQRERRRLLQRIRRQKLTDEERRNLLERRREKKLNEQQRESHRIRNRLRYQSLTDEQRKRINEARRRRRHALTAEKSLPSKGEIQILLTEGRMRLTELRRYARCTTHPPIQSITMENCIGDQHLGQEVGIKNGGISSQIEGMVGGKKMLMLLMQRTTLEMRFKHVHHDGKIFMVH